MEIEIDGIGSQLQGVGRDSSGRAVFVPCALPGERVRVDIVRQADRYAIAWLGQVLSPSPLRTQPVCPLYGRCGGCQAQHMEYGASLEFKRQVVSDALARIGGIVAPNVLPAIGMDWPWRYRNKAEYVVSRVPNGDFIIGAYEAQSHQPIELADCPLQHPSSALAIEVLHGFLCDTGSRDIARLVTRVNDQNQLMVVVGGNSNATPSLSLLADRLFDSVPGMASLHYCALKPRAAHALDGRCTLVRGLPTLPEQLCGLSFELSPQSFFQVNRIQTERLYAETLRAAALTGCETVVDAYCGAGAISLMLARAARKVIGIEIVPEAIRDARANARRNNLSERVEFIEGDAPKVMAQLARSDVRPDVLVVDPPRKGVDDALIQAALQMSPARIAYVSCNPATLARDVRALTAPGGYRLIYAQPVDMFCWTEHVECVALMSRE